MKLLLASKSPRRKELLTQLGYSFEVVSIDSDESFPEEIPPDEVAAYISQKKAEAFRALEEGECLLTADTIVVLEGQILGKPKDREEAQSMLRKLSGKTHQVYTAIVLKTLQKTWVKTAVASVSFLEISEDEILDYIEHYQPMDKAGSYGIQEWIGMAKIHQIEGSFYTIMGLPTHLVYEGLKKFA